jgi:hypothetical protein
MKITLSFDAFAASTSFAAVKQSEAIFFVKAGKAGKVEVNCNSATFTVGSGSKFLDEVTEAALKAGFVLTKRTKGWSIFQIGGMGTKGQDEILADFNRLVEAVSSAAPAATVKMSTAVKKATAAYRVKATTKADLAAIRAKNLATIKAVAAQFKAA